MTSATSMTAGEHRRKSRAEASAWVVRLNGPERSAAVEAAFRDWLAADPEHGREFERVTRVWVEAQEIPLGGTTRLVQWHRQRGVQRWAIGAAVLLICGIAGFGVYQVWFAGVYKTVVGEQRIVRLEDGTRVSLNSDTEVDVSFSEAQRHVLLERGEAFFEVAHNRQRPFVVTVGGHDVTAVGTSFMVRYDKGDTAVTLVEGKVTVSHAVVGKAAVGKEETVVRARPSDETRNGVSARRIPWSALSGSTESGVSPQVDSRIGAGTADPGGSAQVVTLNPGERLVISPNAPATLDEPHIDAVTAWRRGEVVLEHTRLDEAVTEMNRYEERKLVISSPEIAHLEISGIYHVGDAAGFADTIATLYHLQVRSTKEEISITAPARRELRPPAQP